MLWGQIPTWGHLGSQGSKGHFHQNCSNLSILNSLTIILKHMHELETPTYVVESKINLGSLGILQKRAGFVSFQRHMVLVLSFLFFGGRGGGEQGKNPCTCISKSFLLNLYKKMKI